MNEGALPNLLVIGAAKCGTTSLHAYLDQHPDVFMARPRDDPFGHKAMRFFWKDDWRNRLDWYREQFDPEFAVRGEATPSYTHHPYLRGVPKRIHSVVPEAKLIYIVRDPIDRIVAHWAQDRADGRTRASLAQSLSDHQCADHRLVCASRYATQLEKYLEYFPIARILTLDTDDLKADRRGTIRQVFRFLDVDPDFDSPAFDAELNSRREKRALGALGSAVWARAMVPAGRLVPAGAKDRVRIPLRRALSRTVDTPPLDEEIESSLRELLRPEVDRLRQLTGRRFAGWSL